MAGVVGNRFRRGRAAEASEIVRCTALGSGRALAHLLPAAARGRSPSPRAPGPPGGRRPAAAAQSPRTWRRGSGHSARRRSPQPFPPSRNTRGARTSPPGKHRGGAEIGRGVSSSPELRPEYRLSNRTSDAIEDSHFASTPTTV